MSRAARRRRFERLTHYDLRGLGHRQARRFMRTMPAPGWLVARKVCHDGIIWGASAHDWPFTSWWLTEREAVAESWREWRRERSRA